MPLQHIQPLWDGKFSSSTLEPQQFEHPYHSFSMQPTLQLQKSSYPNFGKQVDVPRLPPEVHVNSMVD
jgi:hypothetical protein